MKTAKLATLFLTATMSLGMAVQAAHAQTQAQGKTRAQVIEELKQAQHEGVVPVGKTQYPPTKDMVSRNKELHGISVHAGEKAPQADQHDNLAQR
ncbi:MULTISPECIES: DUF4148 domain-containing protein [Burkholderia]|mgnify:CR=1 FL=1|jgi:Domain of unknown function (DUF4148)|uniref:DUF4148 domain-containing protein n=3 Tax=Burkholderia cepacia complex TaxID=87882 RepID=A0AAP1YEP5_9BURK|nr:MULTISPECIES: DUF4148 domain-containing protein [Burkholderia]EKS9800350.1 DUF4148 domain-containing protein [Burkholderia cepacia]EKS9808281.1 DUF4148 domain-containing protein [Burkholderia cepacia]EKS9815845.1 DUF4148 domain-containing protein [Burkholderia cepacia]EKS9821970.1 DUF4148 domain-containing protein [Burkholderia cepacia]EKS9829595.1 DUF4148 domain-containing protein [Burkholderia cepacia]